TSPRSIAVVPLLAALCALAPSLRAAAFSEADLAGFTDRYCSSCHNDVDKEGGLDLTALKYAPEDPANFLTWVKVHDRVRDGGCRRFREGAEFVPGGRRSRDRGAGRPRCTAPAQSERIRKRGARPFPG